ncbi:CU044_5270 family protein [Embleya sp. NPDC059259]|uniref:CU044_5270 family protein n=1 Tax=unclassified Embleya TaxID=2699296 RepID=UPI0036CEBFA5
MNTDPRTEGGGHDHGHATAGVPDTEPAALAPPAAVPELRPDRHLLLKQHLMHEIRRASATAPSRRPRTLRKWQLVALPVAAAATVAAIIAGVSVAGGDPSGTKVSRAEQRSASALLVRAAVTAETGSQLPVRDGQYEYVRTLGYSAVLGGPERAPTFRHSPIRTTEHWRPVDGTGTYLQRGGSGTEFREEHTGPGNLHRPDYRFMQTLPTDPAELLRLLRKAAPEHGGNPVDQQTFSLIGDLLMNAAAPPAVVGALFRAAALLPGVTVADDTVDSLGRPGVSVARDEVQGSRAEWILDRATSAFTGVREISTTDTVYAPAGTVLNLSSVVERGFVDRPGGRPDTPAAPATPATGSAGA